MSESPLFKLKVGKYDLDSAIGLTCLTNPKYCLFKLGTSAESEKTEHLDKTLAEERKIYQFLDDLSVHRVDV